MGFFSILMNPYMFHVGGSKQHEVSEGWLTAALMLHETQAPMSLILVPLKTFSIKLKSAFLPPALGKVDVLVGWAGSGAAAHSPAQPSPWSDTMPQGRETTPGKPWTWGWHRGRPHQENPRASEG